METKKVFTVSASPHVRSSETVTGIMLDVIIALVPALVAAIAIFGPRAALVVFVCVTSSVFTEYISRKTMKRSGTLGDLSAVVTGLLLAFNLPVSVPLWIAVIGSVVAILVAKQFFGGIGQNFVNPAIAGRIVLLVSFPVSMSSWTMPFAWRSSAEVITTATPLAQLSGIDLSGDVSALISSSKSLPTIMNMFFGHRQGSLGEICAVALLLGGIYLLSRRVIKPSIPLSFIGTVAVIMLIAGKGSLYYVGYQILGGGLLLGAFFMATDYTTSPLSRKGKIIFGIGCGLITSLIRLFGSLPEGVSYAIIIMNILVPLIDRFTMPKPFGVEKLKEKSENTKEVEEKKEEILV